MLPLPSLLAFFSLGPAEMLVIMVVGLLVFGRRLPEVGRQFGRTFLEFRKGLTSFRQEMDLDGDLRDTRNTMRELQREITRPVEIEPWSRSHSVEQVEPANHELDYDHGVTAAPDAQDEAGSASPEDAPHVPSPSMDAAATSDEPEIAVDDGAPFEDRRERSSDI